MDKKPQRIAKEQEVAELQQLLNDCQAAILTDYRGITVEQDVKFRAKLREAGCDYRVAKNTLLQIANRNLPVQDMSQYLEGPTAICFAADPVAAAKIISDFIHENKKTKIKGALLTGKLIDGAEVEALAKLPSREVLLTQVVSALAAPLSGMAGAAAALLRQFPTAVDQLRKQKEIA